MSTKRHTKKPAAKRRVTKRLAPEKPPHEAPHEAPHEEPPIFVHQCARNEHPELAPELSHFVICNLADGTFQIEGVNEQGFAICASPAQCLHAAVEVVERITWRCNVPCFFLHLSWAVADDGRLGFLPRAMKPLHLALRAIDSQRDYWN
jgi:hypothetical protein